MLFNSYVFVVAFLPITVAGFYFAARLGGDRAVTLWLIAAWVFFYGTGSSTMSHCSRR